MFLGRLAAVAALAAGGYWLKKKMDPAADQGSGELSFAQESIEVDVPISTAYNQWTQFEEFPRFMQDVDEVRQVDDTHLHWRARVASKPVEWDSEITTQIPDRRISWRSTSGPPNSGAVTFDRVSDSRTRVTLRMSYRAPGLAEKIGAALGAVRAELSGNLNRFAEFVQSRQRETGAWRGTVTGGSTTGAADARASSSAAGNEAGGDLRDRAAGSSSEFAKDTRGGFDRKTAAGTRDTRPGV